MVKKLNDSKVLNIHRAGAGAFEGLVTSHLGEYLSNADAKVREKSTDRRKQRRDDNVGSLKQFGLLC